MSFLYKLYLNRDRIIKIRTKRSQHRLYDSGIKNCGLPY